MEDGVRSPEFWIRQWESAIQQAAWRGGSGYAGKAIWDYMATDCEKEPGRKLKSHAVADELITGLARKGLFREGMRVLDVGCGIGRMTIPFARRGAEVVALDFSPRMLERLRDATPGDLTGRAHLVEADWDAVDLRERGWEGAFDLVFASMTPAIQRPDSFLKLHRASRHACYFRGWAGKREEAVLIGLWRQLKREALSPTPWDITLAFNLLYALGHSPSIEFQEVNWERQKTVEEAVAFFTLLLQGLTNLRADELEREVKSYLASVAEDGVVRLTTSGRTGAMTWTVD